jgi:hypothetical protein
MTGRTHQPPDTTRTSLAARAFGWVTADAKRELAFGAACNATPLLLCWVSGAAAGYWLLSWLVAGPLGVIYLRGGVRDLKAGPGGVAASIARTFADLARDLQGEVSAEEAAAGWTDELQQIAAHHAANVATLARDRHWTAARALAKAAEAQLAEDISSESPRLQRFKNAVDLIRSWPRAAPPGRRE